MVNMSIAHEIKPKTVAGMTWEEWQAFLQKVQDCTCKPDSALACPACREWSRQRYGDRIPFRGE
jgi:hypothetical protein